MSLTEKVFLKYDETLLEAVNSSVEANFAAMMIERWGMVAATPDGEDSAGRQRLRLPTPEELVERAFECARIYMRVARNEGHIRELGPLAGRHIAHQSHDGWRVSAVRDKSFWEELEDKEKKTKEQA